MSSRNDRISEEAAHAIWRRAAQLQAEAERRMEENLRRLPGATASDSEEEEGLDPHHVRMAGEEAGISPEFVQIALAEASAANAPSSPLARWDVLGAKFFLGSTHHTIEATAKVQGSVDAVSAAVLQVFSGHPCLLPRRGHCNRQLPGTAADIDHGGAGLSSDRSQQFRCQVGKADIGATPFAGPAPANRPLPFTCAGHASHPEIVAALLASARKAPLDPSGGLFLTELVRDRNRYFLCHFMPRA